MGIIVGSETYVECNELGCKNRSDKHFDQSTAKHIAEKNGWLISQNTGKAICPQCRNKR